MRAALLLLAVIAVSACVNLPFFQGKVGFGPSSVTEENPDMLFDVTAVQPEVKAGRTLTIEYLVQNKHEIFDMEKVNLNVYDLCLMGGKGGIFTDLTLKPNRTKSTSEKYSVGSTDFEKSCEIKFRGSYKGHFEASQDVAVLTQAEYDLRSQRGTLGEINPLSSASRNAVTMTISFLESQPYVDGDSAHMYIDYASSGNGIAEKLDKGEVVFTIPKNAESMECTDYEKSKILVPVQSDIMKLKRDLKFTEGKAPRTTCTFTAKASNPVDSKTISLFGNYTYIMDGSIIVKVLPK